MDHHCLGECWRPVPGFPRYSASCTGKIRSFIGRVPRDLSPRWSGRLGHQKVLLREGGKTFDLYIHRLVVEAFIGPIPTGMQVCHENCKPQDNRLDNLRIDAPKGNMADSVKAGRTLRGATNPRAVLTPDHVAEIRARRARGESVLVIARTLSVSRGAVYAVLSGQTWSHLQAA